MSLAGLNLSDLSYQDRRTFVKEVKPHVSYLFWLYQNIEDEEVSEKIATLSELLFVNFYICSPLF